MDAPSTAHSAIMSSRERYRNRSPEAIVEEMKHLNEKFGINMYNFYDELTFYSIPQAERFADVLMASGLALPLNRQIRTY